MIYSIICGHLTIYPDGIKILLYVGKDEKGLIHILAGDKKTSLRIVKNTGYDHFEDDINYALEEIESAIYDSIKMQSDGQG